MAGYYNYSMSNNAVDAYNDGEMPLSKWKKSTILERYEEICDEYNIKMYDLSKVNAAVLKRELLHSSSWHHTSSRFNVTYFYDMSVEDCSRLNDEIVQSLIAEKVIRTKKEKLVTTISKWEVEYLTWAGTRSHPKPTRHIEVVDYDESKNYVNTVNGKKMIYSNGFSFIKKVEDK